MNNIFLVAGNALARSKIFILLSILSGVMLCVAFFSSMHMADNYTGEDAIDIGLADEDNSALSAHFRSYLTEQLGMAIWKDTDYDSLTKALINTDISVIIEVPEGFAEAALAGDFRNFTLTTTNDYENTAFIQAYLDTYMQGIAAASYSAKGDAALFEEILDNSAAEPLTIESGIVTRSASQQAPFAFRFATGFYMMLVMGIAICMNFIVVNDKKLNTLNRMRISSISSFTYVSGTVLSCLLICAPTAIIPLVVIGISGCDIGMSMLLVTALYLLFLLFTIGFALVTSLLFNSIETIIPIMIGIASIGCILGGAWFPIDNSIGVLHLLSYLMPQYWIMNCLDTVLSTDRVPLVSMTPETSAWTAISILMLYTLLMFLIAALFYGRKRIK